MARLPGLVARLRSSARPVAISRAAAMPCPVTSPTATPRQRGPNSANSRKSLVVAPGLVAVRCSYRRCRAPRWSAGRRGSRFCWTSMAMASDCRSSIRSASCGIISLTVRPNWPNSSLVSICARTLEISGGYPAGNLSQLGNRASDGSRAECRQQHHDGSHHRQGDRGCLILPAGPLPHVGLRLDRLGHYVRIRARLSAGRAPPSSSTDP